MEELKALFERIKRRSNQLLQQRRVVFMVAFAIIGGGVLLVATHAATPYISVNADQGTLTSGAQVVSEVNATDGQAVRFGGGSSAKCGLAQVAFCDTFDQPSGVPGSRSGDLNPVWGVSRATAADIPPSTLYNWAAVNLGTIDDSTAGNTICGAIRPVQPPNDVRICAGQAVESMNDNGGTSLTDDGIGQTILAMYPRQPFDFAGRTGTIVFDVSNNTQGTRAAWPAFALTDQPVPAPYSSIPGISDNARNSIGFSFANVCGQYGCGGANNPSGVGQAGFSCIGIDNIYETINNMLTMLPVNQDGCVMKSTGIGSNNHVKVEISSTGMKIYASDPGQPSSTRLIADTIFPSALMWSRGLAWMEDVHWNGDATNTQQSNSFSWDNFGFDGPIIARDLGFDIADNTAGGPTAHNGLTTSSIGYNIPANGGLNLTIPDVTNTAGDAAALLEFTYWPLSPQTISASINGNTPVSFPWPFTPGPHNRTVFNSQTAAISVPLSQLHDGNNSVRFTTSDITNGLDIANIDLIGAGAGGVVNP